MILSTFDNIPQPVEQMRTDKIKRLTQKVSFLRL